VIFLRPRRGQAGKAGRLFLLLLLGGVMVLGIFYVLNSAPFRLEKIVIEGNDHLEKEEIRLLAGLSPGVNLWQIIPSLVERRLLANPWIEEARVARKLPAVVRITIRERRPVAVMPYYSSFLLLSGEGLVLEVVAGIGGLHVPVLSGVPAGQVKVGQVVPWEEVAWVLRALGQLDRSWLSHFAEVGLNRPEGVVLYSREAIPLYLGTPGPELEEKIRTAVPILVDIRTRGMEVEYIDVRYRGNPTIKPRGSQAMTQPVRPDLYELQGLPPENP